MLIMDKPHIVYWQGMKLTFDNTKPHIHPCVCHKIRLDTMKDQDGKKWTQKALDLHIAEINQEELK